MIIYFCYSSHNIGIPVIVHRVGISVSPRHLTTLFCQHLVPHVKSSLLMTHLKFDFGTSIRHISFLWTFNAVSVHIGPAQVILIERPAYQTLSPTLLMSLQPDCKILHGLLKRSRNYMHLNYNPRVVGLTI